MSVDFIDESKVLTPSDDIFHIKIICVNIFIDIIHEIKKRIELYSLIKSAKNSKGFKQCKAIFILLLIIFYKNRIKNIEGVL